MNQSLTTVHCQVKVREAEEENRKQHRLRTNESVFREGGSQIDVKRAAVKNKTSANN